MSEPTHPLFHFIDFTLPLEHIVVHENLRKYDQYWCLVKSNKHHLTGGFSSTNTPYIIGVVLGFDCKWSSYVDDDIRNGPEHGPNLKRIWPKGSKGLLYCTNFSGSMLPSSYDNNLEIRRLTSEEKRKIVNYAFRNTDKIGIEDSWCTSLMEALNKWN